MTCTKTNRINTLSWLNTLGRANTQVRPYDADNMTRRVKTVGADLCVCPDYRRLSDDTHKNKPKNTLSWFNTLGRANTQVRPYDADNMTRRVKTVGADLCVCPDYRRLSDDTHKNKPKNTLSWFNTMGRANTQVRPYDADKITRRVKTVGADLCVCPDYRRLSNDTHKNKPDKYVIMV